MIIRTVRLVGHVVSKRRIEGPKYPPPDFSGEPLRTLMVGDTYWVTFSDGREIQVDFKQWQECTVGKPVALDMVEIDFVSLGILIVCLLLLCALIAVIMNLPQ